VGIEFLFYRELDTLASMVLLVFGEENNRINPLVFLDHWVAGVANAIDIFGVRRTDSRSGHETVQHVVSSPQKATERRPRE